VNGLSETKSLFQIMSSVRIYKGKVVQRIGSDLSTIRSFPGHTHWLFFPENCRATPMVRAEKNFTIYI